MRILILVGWLLVPILAAAWHYGPGQDYVKLDDANTLLVKADAAFAGKKYSEAVDLYDQAVKALPSGRDQTGRRIRVEKAKAMMLAKKLPEARADLETLVDEMQADPKADGSVLNEARATLANSQYYMTWLMRLEGEPREQWESEIDAARQNYRRLAEDASKAGDAQRSTKFTEDVESAIRLARLDLSELQGLPLPSQ